jgi:hypothetical protein
MLISKSIMIQLKHIIKQLNRLYNTCHHIENILEEDIIQQDILMLTSIFNIINIMSHF